MAKVNDRNNSGPSVERRGEFSRLSVNARETKEELQEFLGNMRGKSPQEVLGLVAASGLTQGILWSTIGMVFILIFFTIMPYYAFEDKDAIQAAKKAKAAAAEAADKAAEEAEQAKLDAEEAKQGGKSKDAAVKAMTEEFEETKGGKGDEIPDPLDNLLK
jgi:hypothetical protein